FAYTLRALKHELRHLDMSLHILVEVGMINLAIDLAREIGHFLRTLVHQQQDQNNLGMIYTNGLRDLLEQNRLAHSRRGDDQPALAATERREQIDSTRANRVRLWIFEHNPALRELRRQFLEIGRLGPLFSGPAFNRDDVVQHETFLTVARQP